MNRDKHTAIYDSSMTGRPRAYFCRRCCSYVSRTHVEDMAPKAPGGVAESDCENCLYVAALGLDSPVRQDGHLAACPSEEEPLS